VGRGVGIEEEASELRLFRQAASETAANVKAGLPNLALQDSEFAYSYGWRDGRTTVAMTVQVLRSKK